MVEEKKDDKEVKVEDRRRFAVGENGTVRVNETKSEEKKEQASGQRIIPEANFSNFILSLNAQALVFLGALPHPETNRIESNILLAKHTIDILEVLKEKTKGNLTDEEQSLLDEILFRLKLIYVEVQKKGETR